MANWLIKVVIFSLMVGCSSISSELQTKERLLLSSGENQQLVEFYKGNLAEVPSYKVKLVNLYLEMGISSQPNFIPILIRPKIWMSQIISTVWRT